MRAGWNPRLAERLQRADPDARLIVEAVVTEAEDVRMLASDWPAVGGTQRLTDGGVRLFRNADAALIQSATSDGYDTEFQPIDFDASFNVARLAWPRGTSSSEISLIRLRLVAQLDAGQPQEVARWKCQLFRVQRYDLWALDTALELQPLAPAVHVDAVGGTAAGDVDFDFASTGYSPVIGDDPLSASGAGSASGPIILVVLEALKNDGTAAGNAGWAEDSTLSTVTTGAVSLSRLTLSKIGAGEHAGQYQMVSLAPGLPRMAVFSGGYEAATIGFLTAADRITLTGLSSSTDVELVGRGDTPGGSSITYEASADGATWFAFTDGDVVGEGSLATLPRQNTYYLRASLVPGPGGIVSPVLRALGARAARRVDLDGLASVRTDGWSVDPVTLTGRITAAEITVQRDGPNDYRDLATELVSLYFPPQLAFRIWVGHPDLARGDWLHLDTFLVDDYDPAGGAIRFDCLSVLAQFKAALPVPNVTDPDNVTREPIPPAPASISSTYTQLLDTAGIPERFLGPGIPDVAGDSISKEISDSDLKSELDAVAYLAGGGIITSQGRARFVDMLGSRVPVATFPSEEISIVQATPGLRQRIPEFFVPHSWDGERYAQESRAFDAPSLLNIGTLGLDAPPRLEDIIAQWIHTAPLADQVGKRTVTLLGSGLMLWAFRSTYAHPYLEPGDAVLVATDRFAGKDPQTTAALKGALWALGVVQAVADPLGRDFTVWVRGFRDVFPAAQAVDRSAYPAGVRAYAAALANAAAATASAYADDLVTAEEQARIQEAEANLAAAQEYADLAAAGVRGQAEATIPPMVRFENVALTAALARTKTRVKVTAIVAGEGRTIDSLTVKIGAGASTAIANGGTVDIPRSSERSQDRWLYATATTADGASTTEAFLVDFDSLPGFSSIASPVPIYSGSVITGWRIDGVVDDDTQSVGLALTGGLTLQSSIPVAVGSYLPTAATKSISLTLQQGAGSRGTIALTPCTTTNGTGSESAGTAAAPWSQELSLPPRTTPTLTEITSTIRRITLQTDPAGGRVYVRALKASGAAIATYLPTAAGTIDRGTASTAQRSALGPSLTIFVDLSGVGEDVLLEYYAVAGSVTEAVQRQRIDEDHDPEVGITATGGSNLLAVTATPDDDLVLWRLWARRATGAGAAWPTTDSTEGGIPDDRYRYFEGAQHDRSLSWWAKEGTWYLLARAYDYAGKYTTTTLQVDVTAAASTAAALSALAVARQDNASGDDYHVFTWAHNAPITATSGHVVKVLEGGVVKATKAASTNTAQVVTPEQKTAAEAHAVLRRYEYTLQLVDSGGGVISSYPLTVEGYYDDGTVTQAAPAETPGIPELTKFGKVVTATWANTSTAWEIELDWWKSGSSVYVQTLAASVESATRAYSTGDQAQARVRYTNEAGPGPWSLPSNPLVV